jgi:hypothetical protein
MKLFNQYHFSGLKDDEKILLVVHRHWFDILRQLVLILIMLMIILGSVIFLPEIMATFETPFAQSLFLFFLSLFAVITWLTGFIVWIDYYFDVWIITSTRIININQIGLFSRQVSEMEMEKVQDVSTKVDGVIATFLNYGDVLIQTAGEIPLFQFRKVPNPYAIKDLLMSLQKKAEQEEAKEFGSIISHEIKEG